MKNVILLPPRDVIVQASADLRTRTSSKAERKRICNAEYRLLQGVWVERDGAALLIPSSDDARIYRTTETTCDCPATGRCYHYAFAPLLAECEGYALDTRSKVSHERAQAEINELF